MALPFLVLGSFFVSQTLIVLVLKLLDLLNISLELFMRSSILQSLITIIVYVLTILIVMLITWRLSSSKVSLGDLGCDKLPTWVDIILAPAGFSIYIFLSGLVVYLVSVLLPSFNIGPSQDLGFGSLSYNYEYLLVFMVLVVIGPLCEEVLFRGYLFNKLIKNTKYWLAILIDSLLFAMMHIDWFSFFKSFDLNLVFNSLTIDVFILSIILCLLTKITKSIWPAIIVHTIKNSIAFFVLFIYPIFLLK